MAFNSSSFSKSYNKSPTQKIINEVVKKTVSGLSSESSSIASSVSKALFVVGSTIDAVEALTSLKTDNIVNKSAVDYFVQSSNDPSKSNQSSISKKKNKLSSTGFSSVNPNKKMREKEKKEAVFISVL